MSCCSVSPASMSFQQRALLGKQDRLSTTQQHVGGRQLWHGKGVDREYLLHKLHEFHRVHGTPIMRSIADLQAAFQWLPKSAYEAESVPLVKLASTRSRGPQQIEDLMWVHIAVRSHAAIAW